MFFLGSIFLDADTHDQTVIVSIAPPAHPTCQCRHPHPSEDDLADIILTDANPDSDEDITIVSYRPAPGPSGSAIATPLHDASEDSDIDISKSEVESEADLKDVTVSLFLLFYIFLSSTDKTAGRGGADSCCQCQWCPSQRL